MSSSLTDFADFGNLVVNVNFFNFDESANYVHPSDLVDTADLVNYQILMTMPITSSTCHKA